MLTGRSRALLAAAILGGFVAAGVAIAAEVPVAVPPATVTTDEDVAVQVTLSGTDADPDLLTFSISTQPTNGVVAPPDPGQCMPTPPHTCEVVVTYTPSPDFNGSDSFEFTVADGVDGESNPATVSIIVNPINDAPVALDDPSDACGNVGFGGAFPIPEDWHDPFIFFGPCSLVSNDTDVDLDPLTQVIQTQPAHGAALDLGSGFFSYEATEPDYSTLPGDVPGGSWVSDSFTYVANDGTTDSNSATMRIWIAPINDPPTFTPGDDVIVDEDSGQHSAAWATQVSPGPANESGQAVSFEVVDVDEPGLFSVLPTVAADGALAFTPAANVAGLANITIRAIDDGGLEDYSVSGPFDPPDDMSDPVTFQIVINPVNDPPDAIDDEITLDVGAGTVILDVLDNDTDIEGDSFGVVDASNPDHGTTIVQNGILRYRSDTGFVGVDAFTYTVDDVPGNTDTATVTVTVEAVDAPPVAVDDSAMVDEDDVDAVIDVRANDTDPDSGPGTIVDASGAAHGDLSTDGDDVFYTPSPDYNGPDSFQYTLEDGDGNQDTATVSVTVGAVNDTPSAGDDGTPTPIPIGQNLGPTPLAVLANDTTSPDTGESLAIVAVTQGGHGAVEITGSGSGLTYDPTGAFTGDDSFTYRVSDGILEATATVHVYVAPDITAPVAAIRVVGVAGRTSSSVRVTVTWSAFELQSGITRFQLQQQVDGGAWTTIPLSPVGATRIELILPTGHAYGFRVRGFDGVGNQGDYATSPPLRI